MNQKSPRNCVSITFFPDYRATNPYQTLLYEGLAPAFRAEPGTIDDALNIQLHNPQGTHVFHLHWEHAVFVGAGTPQTVETFLDKASRFKDLGGKIIWTIHNLAPHDRTKDNANADLQSGLSRLADILHLHSLPALAAAQAELALPAPKIRVICHPNYEGAYPVFSRSIARSDLGLPDNGTVVLCPGRIAAYKQPHELIEVFLAAAAPEDRLLLAGETAKGFQFSVPADGRVVHRAGFAEPEIVGRLHAACDFVVLPYRASLTSGSAILAASLGRAVLGTDTPGLRDAVAPLQTGVLFPPGSLADALSAALREERQVWAQRGEAAAGLARARNLRIVAAAWHDVLMSLARPTFNRFGESLNDEPVSGGFPD